MATHTTSAKKSQLGAFFDALASFYHRRWLVGYFIRRQVTRSYRRSYLGFAWAILGPLVWVFFLTLIFSEIVGLRFREVEEDPNLNFGLFLYCGLLPFLAFSEALNKGINSIKGNAGLVQKVVFPLELLPFTNTIASMIDKFFGLGALLIVLLVFGQPLYWTVLLMPFIVVLQIVFILGLTYLMAVLGTYLPDVAEIMRPFIRGMFFLTPIIWTPERLPEQPALGRRLQPARLPGQRLQGPDPARRAPRRAGDALLHPVLRGPVYRVFRPLRPAQAELRGPGVTSAVSLEGIGKRYKISPSRSSLLRETLSFGKVKRSHDFWALQEVDLEVKPGTTLGILGRNGAGKSTLLRIISGVLQPTTGSVEVRGRLTAIFGLGSGFNPEFTGRENAMLNGLILGIDHDEMLDRFDEIEAFAEIGDFMDQPVRTYSSGMKSRLGFAVAVNVDPEVLVLDEALSAGDAAFKKKTLQRMYDLRESGTTILFVSHSMGMVKKFCTDAVLLHKGRLITQGDPQEVADHYRELIEKAQEKDARPGDSDRGIDDMLEREEEEDLEGVGLWQDPGPRRA